MPRGWLLPLGAGAAGAVLVAARPHSLAALATTFALVLLTSWVCLSPQVRGRGPTRLGLGAAAIMLELTVVAGLAFGEGSWFTSVAPMFVVVAIAAIGVVMWRLLRERFSSRATQQALVALVAATSILLPIWVILIEPGVSQLEPSGYAFALGTILGAGLAVAAAIAAWMLDSTGDGSHTIPLLRAAVLVLVFAQALALFVLFALADHPPSGQVELALVLLAAALVAAAAANPSPEMLALLPHAPTGTSRSTITVFVLALAVGPVLTGVSFDSGLGLSLGSIAIGTGLLSVAVAAALGLVLRNFNHADFWVQHDQLTGLPNKESFRSRLEEVIAGIESRGGEVAVLFLDLDRFKVVNDSLGHSAGDQLLEGVARRLSSFCLGGVDIARLGGDEFGILVHGHGAYERSISLAGEIVDQFKKPFEVGHRVLHIAPSIGVARYPTDGRNVEELLRSADSAMYQAKEAGSSQIRTFRPEMHKSAVGRLNLESAMHDAIKDEQLELHYQPQIDAVTGSIVGAEALLRWRHPQLGLLGAGTFIPIAEETGLIVPIGQWVLWRAVEQMVRWLPLVDARFVMAVNLSPRQLELQNVVDMAALALRVSGLDARHLELEVTESAAMTKRGDLEGALSGLSDLGVSLAIDDFGTGFSNLGYLDRLPIDRIKIDASFIQAIDAEFPDSRLVVAVLGLARAMGLEVVAEGVETHAQRDFLLRHDCPMMQGFLFHRPMPAVELERLWPRLRPRRPYVVIAPCPAPPTARSRPDAGGGGGDDRRQDSLERKRNAMVSRMAASTISMRMPRSLRW